MEEAGIDGGGLFKEFMECLVKEGFDPNAGLFKATSDNRLYPNPQAQGLVPNALAYFEFLGQMLGKALYEVVTIAVFTLFCTCARCVQCKSCLAKPACVWRHEPFSVKQDNLEDEAANVTQCSICAA